MVITSYNESASIYQKRLTMFKQSFLQQSDQPQEDANGNKMYETFRLGKKKKTYTNNIIMFNKIK